MSFFYDLNKRLADLAKKTEQQQIAESKKAEAVAQSPLTQALNEGDYSAKKAAAGKDIGKPGKNFAKIAKSAGKKYGSKAAGERVAGAVLNKLRHPKESAEHGDDVMDYLNDKLKDFDAQHPAKEGNAFTGALAKTPKGGKFKVGNKEFTDTSSIEEADMTGLGEEQMDEGYAEMDAWLKSREKEKGTGRFDKRKVSTGTVYTRKPETFDEPEGDEEASDKPKKKGRPAGTKRAIGAKHSGTSKLARKAAIAECNPEEYDQEGDMAKDNLETMVLAAKELHSILGDNDNLPEWVQAKITKALDYINTANDYIHSEKRDMEEGWRGGLAGERPLVKTRKPAAGSTPKQQAYNEIMDLLKSSQSGIDPYIRNHLVKLVRQLDVSEPVAEKAPPGAKAERMVKHIKKSLSKDGKLSDKDKAIAYATTWKAHNAGKVEEEGGDKPDYIDLDKDGDKKEPMKQAAKQAKAKGKKEEVEETTTSGSVATASAAPKSSKGMQFGKGVYESMNSKVENIISEGMNISVNMSTDDQGQPHKSITVSAEGDEADKLAELLKMAGLGSQQSTCQVCGEADCHCEELDENSPDWPTDTVTKDADPNLRDLSGGLNGPKSTGQTTVPVIASQLRRQVSMEESIELERSLFQLYKNYKG